MCSKLLISILDITFCVWLYGDALVVYWLLGVLLMICSRSPSLQSSVDVMFGCWCTVMRAGVCVCACVPSVENWHSDEGTQSTL